MLAGGRPLLVGVGFEASLPDAGWAGLSGVAGMSDLDGRIRPVLFSRTGASREVGGKSRDDRKQYGARARPPPTR